MFTWEQPLRPRRSLGLQQPGIHFLDDVRLQRESVQKDLAESSVVTF